MKKNKKINLVLFVADSTPQMKLFKTKTAANKFIKGFEKKYANKEDDGYWLDLAVYGAENFVELDKTLDSRLA